MNIFANVINHPWKQKTWNSIRTIIININTDE